MTIAAITENRCPVRWGPGRSLECLLELPCPLHDEPTNPWRVYWHGTSPDFARRGTIKRRGVLRHEVLWDGAIKSTFVSVHDVKPLGAWKRCACGRCGR